MPGSKLHIRKRGHKPARLVLHGLILCAAAMAGAQTGSPFWATIGQNPTHQAGSLAATQPLQRVLWSRPVDLNPQYSTGDELLIHYGCPLITHNNVIIWATKT